MKWDEMEKMEHMVVAASKLLDGLAEFTGISRVDQNFTKTPERMVKALLELCSGSVNFKNRADKILDTSFPDDVAYDEMVFQDNIFAAGVCPHHLIPVEYRIHVAYVPNPEESRLVGISKLARIATLCASRPVMQEVVTQDILHLLEKLNPLGVGVFVAGKHGCIRLRGAKQHNSVTKTTAFSGIFKSKHDTRAEFMGLVNESNRS